MTERRTRLLTPPADAEGPIEPPTPEEWRTALMSTIDEEEQ